MTESEFKKFTGKPITFSKVFSAENTFGAVNAAEEWLRSRGYSVGIMCRDEPMGIAKGDFRIEKWYNLGSKDRALLDGLLIGADKRNGPVTVLLSGPVDE